MSSDKRQTGRTESMLNEVVRCDAPVVVVIAHTDRMLSNCRYRLLQKLSEARSDRVRREITRADGRRILFMQPKDVEGGRLRGLYGKVFIDHAVWQETLKAPFYGEVRIFESRTK